MKPKPPHPSWMRGLFYARGMLKNRSRSGINTLKHNISFWLTNMNFSEI